MSLSRGKGLVVASSSATSNPSAAAAVATNFPTTSSASIGVSTVGGASSTGGGSTAGGSATTGSSSPTGMASTNIGDATMDISALGSDTSAQGPGQPSIAIVRLKDVARIEMGAS